MAPCYTPSTGVGERRTLKSRYQNRKDVEVVDYDPAWTIRFGRERTLILQALGDMLYAIEHIGSTSVPSLRAKPIVDIMVAVERLSDGEPYIGPLDEVGYEYRGDGGFSNHLFWRKGDPRQVNLHMVEIESDFWREHIVFRDRLRAEPELAQEYGKLKMRLAKRYSTDKVGYNQAKEPFIRRVLRLSEST